MKLAPVALALGMMTPVLLFVAPSASADPAPGVALVVGDPLYEKRCYLYAGVGPLEYWVESNGVTTGGVPTLTGEGSGLQRQWANGLVQDARVNSPVAWAQRCAPSVEPPEVPEVPDPEPLPTPPEPPCEPFPTCAVPEPPPPCTPFPDCAVPPLSPLPCEGISSCRQVLEYYQLVVICLVFNPPGPTEVTQRIEDCGGPSVPAPDACDLVPQACEPLPAPPCEPLPQCEVPPPPCEPSPACLVPEPTPPPCEPFPACAAPTLPPVSHRCDAAEPTPGVAEVCFLAYTILAAQCIQTAVDAYWYTGDSTLYSVCFVYGNDFRLVFGAPPTGLGPPLVGLPPPPCWGMPTCLLPPPPPGLPPTPPAGCVLWNNWASCSCYMELWFADFQVWLLGYWIIPPPGGCFD